MSEFENLLWGEPAEAGQAPPSQLEWEQLLKNPGERKRTRPMSFDKILLQLQEGGSNQSWGEQYMNGGALQAQEGGQFFGGYGEKVDTLLADSAESALYSESVKRKPPPSATTSESSAALSASDALAGFNRQDSAPLPSFTPISSLPHFSRQTSDPLPVSSPPVAQLAPTRSENVVPKSFTNEEIYKAYAESWGGALQAKPSPARGPELQAKAAPPKKAQSKLARTTNAAKAQAASFIRDLFRRPGAKRQAVPIEGGHIGSLEKALSQMSAQPIKPPPTSVPPRTSSGSSSREHQTPSESRSVSLPPLPNVNSRGVPRSGSGKRTSPKAKVSLASGNDLATLQKEAQALLAAMGGPAGQEKGPPISGEKLVQGGEKECPLLKAVDVASSQVALSCPVNLDKGLLLFDPVSKLGGEAAPGAFERQVSFGVAADLGDLASLDWLLPAENGARAKERHAMGASPSFSSDSLWSAGFPDLLADGPGSVRMDLGTRSSSQVGGNSEELLVSSDSGVIKHLMHVPWAQLEPSEIKQQRFQLYRSKYKEEVRRLRIWAATYVGEELLPAVAELHFVSCSALPNLEDRQQRLVLTKGLLWSAYVTRTLETASPADLYFARHDAQKAYKGANPAGLNNMSKDFQNKCKNMCFLAEDLKDEATYGPEIFRTYGALHKCVGVARPPPEFGHGYQQITFPELTDVEPDSKPEVIEFEKDQILLKGVCPEGLSLRWGVFWFNKLRLLSTGKGLKGAGEHARECVQVLAEKTVDAHVDKFDVMATGASPSLEKYLSYSRYDLGTAMALGLSFCSIGQQLADAGKWEPDYDEVEQLFEEAGRAIDLAGNVVRIMSDLRTYQADLVQLRLNAVAVRMREGGCSHKEALDFLIARASSDLELLAAEIKAHKPKGHFASACWRLPFELCRASVARFTVLSAGSRAEDLFEMESAPKGGSV